jgi:hypothetical protein
MCLPVVEIMPPFSRFAHNGDRAKRRQSSDL